MIAKALIIEVDMMMESLVNFIAGVTNATNVSSAFDDMFNISNSSMILVLALTLLGTTLVSNLTMRNSSLNYVTTFSCLLIGALLANSTLAGIELPVASALAQTAIAANLGMIVASLLLLAVYGRSGFIEE